MNLLQPFAPFKRPDFKLEIGGKDVTATVRDRLLSLSLTDNDGWESDSVQIELDNRDNRIPLPKYEEAVKVWLGHEDKLAAMGSYKVNDSTVSLRPRTLSISCAAADMMKASLKVNKTRGWNEQTLGAIVAAIAKEHGLKFAVSDELTGLQYPQVDQANESDLNLLTRLGKDYEATVKVANGYLLVTVKDDGKSMTGQLLPTVTLNEWDVQPGASIRTVNRQKYAAVACEYREVATGEAKTYQAGGGEPVLTLKGMAPTLEQAKARADLSLKKQSSRLLDLSCTTVHGNPGILYGTVIKLGEGWHPDYDGLEFIAQTANHQYSGSYVTSVTAILKV